MSPGVVEEFFIRDGSAKVPPAARILYADGSAGPEFRAGVDLELSHWVPNTTPARWKADTSTEICLRFAADPPDDRYDLAINNHVDVDGILSVFSLVHSKLALAHRDVVVGAAEMGDFSAGVDRPAFRLAHELTMLLAESRRAGWDARTSYENGFSLARAILEGARPEPDDVERAWSIVERGRARIASGEVQVEPVGERLVIYRLPLLEGDELSRALRVPPFNPLIDDSVWLWPTLAVARTGSTSSSSRSALATVGSTICGCRATSGRRRRTGGPCPHCRRRAARTSGESTTRSCRARSRACVRSNAREAAGSSPIASRPSRPFRDAAFLSWPRSSTKRTRRSRAASIPRRSLRCSCPCSPS
jgi:hypothetical protein